ncbi:MAG: nucleotidyltransferase family protein [Coprococcus sp.]|nr:nucleotidyltransferase family protein [Coprococcus sp.]
MSTVGIVCEYNPFHKGHQYQINMALEKSGADSVVCFMSGNFLQRGVPALADKYTRAHIALREGVAAVFEIPFVYATSSARDYAYAAVALMNKLRCIDYISFGAETNNLELLKFIAHITINEPEAVSKDINQLVSSGLSYGRARATAICSYIKNGTFEEKDSALLHDFNVNELDDILASPNNILAIEYLAALEKTESSIKPVLIPRAIAHYNSTSTRNDICSATAIREKLKKEDISFLSRHVPASCYDILKDAYKKTFPVFDDSLSQLLSGARLMGLRTDVVDMDNDLAGRFSKLDINMSYNETALKLKCRNYTLTHIQRALLHYIFQLTPDIYSFFKEHGTIYYARLLGMRLDKRHIVNRIKKCTDIPIITKTARANDILDYPADIMFSFDTRAQLVYSNIVYNKYGENIPDDFRQKPNIVR